MSFLDENSNKIYNNIKELLINGAKDRNHSFHTPIFTNNNDISGANSRVIVLRKFNYEEMNLIFNTDYRSPKINNLKKNNQSNFVFMIPKLKFNLE